jgi:hypothetical protein
MASELITVEYAGPTSHQVGNIPCYDVRAWWHVVSDRTEGNVKRAANLELKRHVKADHVEFVRWDVGTYNSPNLDAMITFRVLTSEQFAARAELRTRVYATCDGCGCDHPGQVVRMAENGVIRMDERGPERALCFGCWNPIKDTCQVLHWIKSNGKLQA